jgi:RNA polymerase sigma-70 factor (ECF subfamily)
MRHRRFQVETNAGQAIEQLIEQYGKLIFHIIFGLTSHWQESQDLTQETFLLALRNIDAARQASGSHFQARAWLVRIAINLVRRHYRRQRTIRFLTFSELQREQPADVRTEGLSAVEEEIQSADDLETLVAERDTVQRCMQQLPESLRTPLLLSLVVGFSQREVAAMLGLQEATVRQRLSRARKVFQRLYAYECGEHLALGETGARARRPVARGRDHSLHRLAALAPAAAG